ncbi:flagellar motor switch protein FliG [Rickettsiales endosymbiont of Stachyamoeba lipophora]|uniref:flagellar motor switch protein FliG n=1 Tax=Rickettsiales endosymbiont of Stachyamoeba lipophora TaxID=2486578 RepID=UPI000F655BE1|nr:flagellar motor switch protein FliG [Rickettsiales endosymbiont of Stachyamoeba lipophora]AZL15200.1 flagellar motor switch protein FliG [Rickettsiales endosymbiont of Stachyamoeba lipophora]
MLPNDGIKLNGYQKAAIILFSVEEDHAAKIFSMMSDEEIKGISFAMSTLGSIKQEAIDRLLFEFNSELSGAVSFFGNFEATERLLEKVLGKEKVAQIMDEIHGPAGKNTWDRLKNVNEDILANYLRNEYPQTIALIISKLQPTFAANLLSMLPEELTFDVMLRILNMDSVKKEIVDGVEKVLRAEFINTLSKSQKQDSNLMLAEIFNNFDRTNEAKFMSMLEQRVPESADKIKSLMFTFDDLIKVSPASIQSILRVVDKSKLTVALKGAKEDVKNLFISNMSQRAAQILKEDMEALGPVRIKDVDESQAAIIQVVKDLASKGDVVIQAEGEQDEYIY